MNQPLPVFDGSRAFASIVAQTAMGHRYPGSPGHAQLRDYLRTELSPFIDEGRTQPFTVPLRGEQAECENILALIRGRGAGKSILIGTHFDTRLIGDREINPLKRDKPIPGANDGGSGTAVMLELARLLHEAPPPRDVILAFFDAEDVGGIDGNEFYRGSGYFSEHMGDFRPGEVLILDMVGGRDMRLDIDLNALCYDFYYNMGNRDILLRIMASAARLGHSAFFSHKKDRFKYIGCDHIPFLQQLIPSWVLIDIDYPQWHTQQDIPAHCAVESLKAVGDVVLSYIHDPSAPIKAPPITRLRPERSSCSS